MKQISFEGIDLGSLGREGGPKVEYEFQAVGLELQEVYGKRIWPLFYKYPLWKIKDAAEIAKRRGNSEFGYLIGIIKRL